MQKTILTTLLPMLLNMIDSEDLKKWADMGLDVVEEKYKDNATIIGMCNLIRKAFDVPDND